jgi:hypothetical protein
VPVLPKRSGSPRGVRVVGADPSHTRILQGKGLTWVTVQAGRLLGKRHVRHSGPVHGPPPNGRVSPGSSGVRTPPVRNVRPGRRRHGNATVRRGLGRRHVRNGRHDGRRVAHSPWPNRRSVVPPSVRRLSAGQQRRRRRQRQSSSASARNRSGAIAVPVPDKVLALAGSVAMVSVSRRSVDREHEADGAAGPMPGPVAPFP